ncbi:hypothetical protein J2Z65_006619 [Paenibacillus aceris]|uniref:Secreted protein n=1 Tax=Paenibacillus aceris TaxID=869555 RepID=A0ABS4I8V2_9BACL|nr:hypothetical protein [Paenibacillus aceris]
MLARFFNLIYSRLLDCALLTRCSVFKDQFLSFTAALPKQREVIYHSSSINCKHFFLANFCRCLSGKPYYHTLLIDCKSTSSFKVIRRPKQRGIMYHAQKPITTPSEMFHNWHCFECSRSLQGIRQTGGNSRPRPQVPLSS